MKPTSRWRGSISAPDLQESISQLAIPGDPAALQELLEEWQMPAATIPSLRAAHRALLLAEQHLAAAYAVADAVAAGGAK
jgi:hypothetical protein